MRDISSLSDPFQKPLQSLIAAPLGREEAVERGGDQHNACLYIGRVTGLDSSEIGIALPSPQL